MHLMAWLVADLMFHFKSHRTCFSSVKELVLLRFAKKSPTLSPGIDIDVTRLNIDVLNILELQNHNSGTIQRTEMADHLLKSLGHKRERPTA